MEVLVWQGGLVGPPRALLGYAVIPSPFMETTDSSYQNTNEYLAILLGLLLSKSLGLRDGVFAVLGDSRSSLAWVLQGLARSTCEYRLLYIGGECGRGDIRDRARPFETQCSL
jgi:hypothetical protein